MWGVTSCRLCTTILCERCCHVLSGTTAIINAIGKLYLILQRFLPILRNFPIFPSAQGNYEDFPRQCQGQFGHLATVRRSLGRAHLPEEPQRCSEFVRRYTLVRFEIIIDPKVQPIRELSVETQPQTSALSAPVSAFGIERYAPVASK